MNTYNYDVSFRIFHPTMNPDDICNTLNMQADTKSFAGEPRKTPTGRPLKGIYNHTYCSFRLDRPDGLELSDFLKYWNDFFLKYMKFFNEINSTGGRLEYFIGWYSNKNSGEVFDVSLLKDLVALKIELAIDFYGGYFEKVKIVPDSLR